MHGHHIVFKKGDAPSITATGAAAAQEARDMLLYVGINPYWSVYNLAFAPNYLTIGHPQATILDIRDRIREHFEEGADTQSMGLLLGNIATLWNRRALSGL